MSESLEDLLICQICLEEYQESGSRIPRILPCSHTLCERCLIQLLAGVGVLKCPVCKTQHAAPRKLRTFPQNKFILTFISWKAKQSEKKSGGDISLCPNHEKELTLFCKETQCQTLICSVCMTRKHKKHDVVDVDEHQKENLLDNLDSSIQTLSFKKDQITTVQVKNELCLKKLKEEKMSILKLVRDKYDSMIQEAENQKENSKSMMTSLEENLVLLNNIKQYIRSKTLSLREVKNCQETVDTVTERNEHAPLELCYMEYTENKDKERLMLELCGEMSLRNHNIKLPGKQSEPIGNMFRTLVKQSSEMGHLLVKPVPMARRLTEMQRTQVWNPRFQLKRSVETLYTGTVPYLTATGRDFLFVCGKDTDSKWTLAHYNLLTGEQRCTVRLVGSPHGMTTFRYNNRECIALSFIFRLSGGCIEYRPVDNLKQFVHRLEVRTCESDVLKPRAMCAVTSSPSQLLYYDWNTDKMHRVDCSTTPPTPRGKIPFVHDGLMHVNDMCTSDDLLVVAMMWKDVLTYTLDGGELKWKVSGKLPEMEHTTDDCRVTADDQGHLFLCDKKNSCVHALSVRDGKHLGVVVRKGQDGVGKPCNVTWHQESASLIVAHERDGVYHLSVFSRQH